MKKFLSLFVALAMVLSLFAGVGALTAKAVGDTTPPQLIVTAHNEFAKTITYTFNEAVQFTYQNGDGVVLTADIPAILNIFRATSGGDYGLDTVPLDVHITAAAFTSSNTILTIHYTGSLVKTYDQNYVVDYWVANTPANEGWDLEDLAGNMIIKTSLNPMFTVVAHTQPFLTAVTHSETAKTITYAWNEPVHFETEWGDVVTPVSPAILNIFVTTGGNYDLDTVAPHVTITSATFDATSTILTVTYAGSLVTSATSIDYIVDSWVVPPAGHPEQGGWDIKNLLGQVDVAGVNPVFTVTGDTIHPFLANVAHNETAKTITYTWNEPVHFETEWGDVVTPVSPAILNIFVTSGGNYDLTTIAAGVTITAATFDSTSTILTVTYTGSLVHDALTYYYVVDSWVSDGLVPGSGGYDIKDAVGNVDVAGVNPVFAVLPATYTVTFDSQGGSAVAAITSIAYNTTVTLPTPPPTRAGYTFASWNTAAAGTGTAFTASTAVTANVTVYAQWTPIASGPVGVYRSSISTFYLRATNGTFTSIAFGNPGDTPIIGDWDGDGIDDIGVYRSSISTFYLRATNGTFTSIAFGNPGDTPIIGDWNGDGTDDIGVYRSSISTFYLRATNGTFTSIAFGNPGDTPIIGDWNSDPTDEIGVYRSSVATFYLRATNGTFTSIAFGNPGDTPIIGDWNDDGTDDTGVYRSSVATFYLRATNGTFTSIVFGNPGDTPIIGIWPEG